MIGILDATRRPIMPRSSPYVITLTPKERKVLEARAHQYTLSYRDVVRAKIVLLAADGLENGCAHLHGWSESTDVRREKENGLRQFARGRSSVVQRFIST